MATTSKETARWNLSINKETDIAVRTFLARSGFKKGDLSAFVEEAVRWRVWDQTLQEARDGFGDLSPDDVASLADEAIASVRAEMVAEGAAAPYMAKRKSAKRK